jgi:hypothetical protein
MYEDIMARQQNLYGDVVIADPDVGSKAMYVEQLFYADDMLTSGDEGIGFAQARRLKSKLRRNRRRITETGYAVSAGTPYQFGANPPISTLSTDVLLKAYAGERNPWNLANRHVSASRQAGTELRRRGVDISNITPTATGGKVKRGGGILGGAFRAIKKIKPLKVAAKVAPYVAGGVVGGALLKKGVPALFRTAKKLVGGAAGGREEVPAEAVAVTTETPAGAPVPAPTGAMDTTGKEIPPDIMRAMAAAVSPMPSAAPTASEDVASTS